MNKNKPIVFILAGGSGTRLAPLSSSRLPKQFLALIGEKTMIQNAVESTPENLKKFVISVDDYVEKIKEQVGDKVEVIAEPFRCNTAIAIGLGAICAKKAVGNEDAVLFFMPSDHTMNKEVFRSCFETAIENAKPGKIVILGITPDRPETGLGYIKIKKQEDGKVVAVERFVEKPDLENAKKFVESGEYFWNAGMFCLTIGTVLEKLKKNSSTIYESLMRIEKDLGSEKEKETIRKEYESIKKQGANISFDYAVMEKESEDILLVKAEKEIDWDDIGLWIALKKYFPSDENYNTKKGLVGFKNSSNILALNYVSNQRIDIDGLNDFLIVNTKNGIFICPQSSSIRASEIVPGLNENQKEIIIDSHNINIKNETSVPIACIDCQNLKVDIEREKILINAS